jgi:hypothetical protein
MRSVPAQVCYIALAALFAFSTVSDNKCTAAACTPLAVVAFVLVYAVLLGFQLAFNAAFLFSRNNKNVLTQHRVEVKDEGLYEETTYSRCLFLWPGIHKVIHAAGMTAVYVTAHSAILVPDHTFSSLDDRDEFLRRVKGGRDAV